MKKQTFLDVFKTFQNYQYYCAKQTFDYYENPTTVMVELGGTKTVFLYDIPFEDRTMKQWKETDVAYEVREYAAELMRGAKEDRVYKLYWERLKNEEWPEWREKPVFD